MIDDFGWEDFVNELAKAIDETVGQLDEMDKERRQWMQRWEERWNR